MYNHMVSNYVMLLTIVCVNPKVTGSKLLTEVQKRREPLKQDCTKVADVVERLKHLQELKSAVSNNFSQLMSRLEELCEKARKLVQEKKILTIELLSKERECQLLSEMKEKDAAHSKRNEAHIAMIEEKINKKRNNSISLSLHVTLSLLHVSFSVLLELVIAFLAISWLPAGQTGGQTPSSVAPFPIVQSFSFSC